MHQLVTYNSLVGYVLEQRRLELGYDQNQVASEANISQPVLSRLEKGKASITIDQLFVLSNALRIAPDEVIQKASDYTQTFQRSEGIEVVTGKQSETPSKTGSQAKALLAGAAIGAVLALLANRG